MAEKLVKALETKIQLLKLTNDDTVGIIAKSKLSGLERQLKTMRGLLEDIHELKIKVQEVKLTEKSPEDVKEWTSEIRNALEPFEDAITEIEEAITFLKNSELEKKREEEEIQKAKAREEQLKFEKEKLEQKLQYEKHMEDKKKDSTKSADANAKMNAKLPKLVITKFNGAYADWLRFWNQFEAEIHEADIPAVTKFAYLKELVEPKVKTCIDGLPFNSEGYERARNILKSRYGKISEIVNAYVQNLLALPTIHGSQPAKILSFYETLVSSVQSLQTLGKLRDVNGYVRATLDKLEGIRGDLVRTDDDWQSWDFPKLVEALRKWVERNPVVQQQVDKPQVKFPSHSHIKRGKNFNTRQEEGRGPKGCVYCAMSDHKSSDCPKVVSIADRKKELTLKQLCYNCARPFHKSKECKSRSVCQKCKSSGHHTSICDKAKTALLTTSDKGKGAVTYPVVIVEVNGIRCRALLDTGAGSSYASAALLERLQIQPQRKELKRIEMMLGATNKLISVYNIKIDDIEGKFNLQTEVTKVDRGELLTLNNPNYHEMISKFSHLKDVKMNDEDKKEQLPIHVILGASDYAKIKTKTTPKIGQPGEPVAELTKFGWTILSPGKETDLTNMLLTQTANCDYERLCRLDVLGLEDSSPGDQNIVYEEFKEQLVRNPEGYYESGLPWRANHPFLSNNKHGSLRRLNGLVRKLEKQGTLEQYNEIIEDQLQQGIVELASDEVKGREFYIPHKPVIRESAETTKMRIVYDASARADDKSPSLNQCLETGPPLKNQLWDVLVRNRLHAINISGDLKQAFLQVRIKECERDALRFHWLKDLETKEVQALRFTRALFGLSPSPFLLNAVIKEHLQQSKSTHANPHVIEEIERCIFVDDLIGGGKSTNEARQMKEVATKVFSEAKFKLHKWHSNMPELETETIETDDEQQPSYAKQQLGVKSGETKLLGLPWDKINDTIHVSFPEEMAEPTKRGILAKVAKIYDPLGLVAPTTLTGKLLYRDACDLNVAWDTLLPSELRNRISRWEHSLPQHVPVPRSLAKPDEPVLAIDLHAFSDASLKGVASAVYGVVYQPSSTSQNLLTAKSRLSKKGLTIPRLELVSGHMAGNLLENVKQALTGFPVNRIVAWLDSSVALHWIRGKGEYKQFVSNRVHKIQEKNYIEWRHVSTHENPADLASRGGIVDHSLTMWWQGPDWLSDPERWPKDIQTCSTDETQAEAKAVKELFAVAVQEPQPETDELDRVIEKYDNWKAIRVTSWVYRFVHNARSNSKERIKGPLTTDEISKQVAFWVKRVQSRCEETSSFEEQRLQLNLKKDDEGIYRCMGRIQGHYPIYLPNNNIYTEKLVIHTHRLSCHGGVRMTMSKFREKFWTPKLRSMVKRLIKNCFTCKRFRVSPVAVPPPGNLPKDRTEGTAAYQVVGVDYAGPIKYRMGSKKEGKAYIILYACSLTRGLYLELLPNQETEEFIRSLKRLIARRGRPHKIYSDNAKTFVAAAKWLKGVMHDEKLHNWLSQNEIKWQFNVSRAPWWGGQFERMVSLVKQALYKSIGQSHLTWCELQDVLLDIEVALNNRPLSYVEDDIELPILTPNSLMFGLPNLIPEEKYQDIDEPELRKRARHLQRCKDVLWGRWTKEYLKGLRERHNLKHNTKELTIKVGDVVIIKSDERNRNKWKLGIVDQLIQGRDGVVRVAKLRAGKSYLERPIQHLYPLELSCDKTTPAPQPILNANAPAFRPKRDAAAAANLRILQNASVEEQED